MESNFTPNPVETKIRIATYPQCFTELREVFPTSEKALRNLASSHLTPLQTDFQGTHATQMKTALTRIAIMEYVRQNANLMITVASSNHAQLEAISSIRNAFRRQMREKTVTKRLRTHAALWLCAMKANAFDSSLSQ